MYGEKIRILLEICLATIGVCAFRCAGFGWRTFFVFMRELTRFFNVHLSISAQNEEMRKKFSFEDAEFAIISEIYVKFK